MLNHQGTAFQCPFLPSTLALLSCAYAHSQNLVYPDDVQAELKTLSKNISGYSARLEIAEGERQQLHEELEDSNDRVAYLENCMEKTESLEAQLADTLQALQEVYHAAPICLKLVK